MARHQCCYGIFVRHFLSALAGAVARASTADTAAAFSFLCSFSCGGQLRWELAQWALLSGRVRARARAHVAGLCGAFVGPLTNCADPLHAGSTTAAHATTAAAATDAASRPRLIQTSSAYFFLWSLCSVLGNVRDMWCCIKLLS